MSKLGEGVKSINPQDTKISFVWKNRKCIERIKDFKLNSITPMELKEALNEVPAKYAFYSSLYSDIILEVDKHKTDFDLWYVNQYAEVSEKNSKATESAKKNQVYLRNPDRVRGYHKTLNRLNALKMKVRAIVDAYEMQSRILQTLSAVMRQELAVLRSGGGSGSLED